MQELGKRSRGRFTQRYLDLVFSSSAFGCKYVYLMHSEAKYNEMSKFGAEKDLFQGGT